MQNSTDKTPCERFSDELNELACSGLQQSSWYDYCFVATKHRIYDQAYDIFQRSNITNKYLTKFGSNNTHLENTSQFDFKLNCESWTDRLQTCIILWDLLICIIIHLVAIIVSLMALFRHKIGRFYSFILFMSSVVQPITMAILTAYIIKSIATQIEPTTTLVTEIKDCKIRDYSSWTNKAPIYSLLIALILNGFMLVSSFFSRRILRFL